MNTSGGLSVVVAKAPLAEMQRYATDLRSITQGRGAFTTTFSHYAQRAADISPAGGSSRRQRRLPARSVA